jgi:hypothetical protein
MDRLMLAARAVCGIFEPRMSSEARRRRAHTYHHGDGVAMIGAPRLENQSVGQALIAPSAQQTSHHSPARR